MCFTNFKEQIIVIEKQITKWINLNMHSKSSSAILLDTLSVTSTCTKTICEIDQHAIILTIYSFYQIYICVITYNYL